MADESDRVLLRRSVEEVSDLGIWGSLANLGIWTRCWLEEREIRGLEEAIIELAAMATHTERRASRDEKCSKTDLCNLFGDEEREREEICLGMLSLLFATQIS